MPKALSSRGARSASGHGVPVNPVAGGARPLLVPAADVSAKNRRAAQMSHPSSHYTAGRGVAKAVSILDSLAPSARAATSGGPPKFSRFEDDTPPILARLKSLFARTNSTSSTSTASSVGRAKRTRSAGNPALRALAKASDALNASPSPTIVLLGLMAATLLMRAFRPEWLLRTPVRIGLRVLYALTLTLALLWRRGAPLRAIAAGRSPFFHPTDASLDPYAETLDARAAATKAAEEELKLNRAKLDALRRELARDPNAAIPGAMLVPSRKAAAMIAEGALGAGYDPDKAAEAERLRKVESIARSRAQWKELGEGVEGSLGPAENMMRLHASNSDGKKTKQIKNRSLPAAGPANTFNIPRRRVNTQVSENSGVLDKMPMDGSFRSEVSRGANGDSEGKRRNIPRSQSLTGKRKKGIRSLFN